MAGFDSSCAHVAAVLTTCLVHLFTQLSLLLQTQVPAMNISAQASMKGAAKCDNHCELQDSENQQVLERALHSWDMPGSMPASVLVDISCSRAQLLPRVAVHYGLCICKAMVR